MFTGEATRVQHHANDWRQLLVAAAGVGSRWGQTAASTAFRTGPARRDRQGRLRVIRLGHDKTIDVTLFSVERFAGSDSFWDEAMI